jgi:hypothetical protein
MVRKSDAAELSELKKFGFKYGTRNKFEYKTKQNGLESRIYIDLLPCNNNNNEIHVECYSYSIPEKILDKLYDLTKANLIVKE